ncbi:hypothetical protein PMZ80_000868 [Knufia obscura]|uniref:Nucleoside phosphorylase domain-containing protein n=2 Tax=Knufia TaxID=430999 RepID=A0AAN8EEU4_9EURO|nr:hypothetical protein PMZ80_000868 [Knufia obscura]KAK5949868.1 hypothetical protein OHC33_009053 [Knufia fluminis]
MPVVEDVTVGYICPLYTELKAVLATFDNILPPQTIRGTKYFYGTIRGRLAVAVPFPYQQIGPLTALNCANKLLQAHPSLEEEGSYCLLVGIAGGIWTQETDVRLGDVVIATKTWDWRTGKQTSGGLISTQDVRHAPSYLLDGLGQFLYRRSQIGQKIKNEITCMQGRSTGKDDGWVYPGKGYDDLYDVDYRHAGGSTCDDCDRAQAQKRLARLDTSPRVHDGLVASGNVVLKHAKGRAVLEERRALAVEMEACGLPDIFAMVRGISDYADSHKNDIWQPYAAATAAACARLLIHSLDEVRAASNSSTLDAISYLDRIELPRMLRNPASVSEEGQSSSPRTVRSECSSPAMHKQQHLKNAVRPVPIPRPAVEPANKEKQISVSPGTTVSRIADVVGNEGRGKEDNDERQRSQVYQDDRKRRVHGNFALRVLRPILNREVFTKARLLPGMTS